MRLGVHADKTRFVIELSGNVEYRAFSLADPSRIVIDLPEIDWRMRPPSVPGASGLVERFRYGLLRPGVSRVVLDLKRAGRIKNIFLLPPHGENSYRLVLDIEPGAPKLGSVRSSEPAAGQSGRAQIARNTPARRFSAPARKPGTQRGKTRIIVIDPGHGGVDPGATGRSGIFEKSITLAAARDLKYRLERSGRYKVMLTRDRDIFLRLRDRVESAREKEASLFLSLHADTIRKKSIRGLSVYTLSENASDKESAELAEKENKADLIAGIDLSGEAPEVTNILIDLAQRETMNESARVAGFLVRELKNVAKLLPNTHRFAGFAVLKAPDIPSVLIEMGFLSNASDEKALRSKKYRARFAGAIARAIVQFFNSVEQADRL
ncbi:MAG: N-acetylmuramoyl-L-alanine amidase [Rhodospirillales bacterium]|nr:N-acetylmuramoyl-L-alanine amidase [Rhodospirillales bacterium]